MSGSEKQIQQMVRFIEREADEKANEIRVKADHDFHKDKQLRVHKAVEQTDEHFRKRIIQLESDKKVARSKTVAAARRMKGETAHELLQEVKQHTLQLLAKKVRANAAGYEALLSHLLTEALVSIDETRVTIECLPNERGLVESVIAGSLASYKEQVAQMAADEPVKYRTQLETSRVCSVQIDESRPLSGVTGGIKVVGANGRIICDNTLDSRLNIVAEEVLPAIRASLFPSMKSRVIIHGSAETKHH